jgi:hypothetical protein
MHGIPLLGSGLVRVLAGGLTLTGCDQATGRQGRRHQRRDGSRPDGHGPGRDPGAGTAQARAEQGGRR